MLFEYSGFDKNGKTLKDKIEADNEASAKAQIKAKQIIIKSIKVTQEPIWNKISFLKKTTLKPVVLATISKDISIYLKSGISLLNALKLISTRYKDDRVLNPFFLSIIAYLDEGKNLFTALQLQNVVKLPEFYLQSIKVSEEGGMLQDVLEQLAHYLKEQDKINKQISSAMTYPIFIMIVSFGMVEFMLSFIVPKITAIFDDSKQALPPITEFVINAGDFVNNNYILITLGFFGFFAGFAFLLHKFPTFKYRYDSLLLRLPFVGSLVEIGELSRFSYMNSILIKSGVPVVQSFNLSSNILKNSVIKKLFLEASAKVVEGNRLSNILDNSSIYKIDIAFIQAVAIGEETSGLSEILENLAELYTTKNQDKISTFLTLLEPMFMLIVGGIIGFIVVAMLLPIFSMSIS